MLYGGYMVTWLDATVVWCGGYMDGEKVCLVWWLYGWKEGLCSVLVLYLHAQDSQDQADGGGQDTKPTRLLQPQ